MSSGPNIDLGLTGYDELFMDDRSRSESKLPHIHEIPLAEIDDFPDHPFKVKLDEDMDLVVTTAEHAPFLETILPDRKKIALVALRLSMETLSGLMKLRPGTKVGILTYSSRFGDLLYDSCRKYAKNLTVDKPMIFCPELDAGAFVKGKDMILVPKGYEKYCSVDAAKTLRALANKGGVVECFYEMDEGSCLHLEEKLQQLRKNKQI